MLAFTTCAALLLGPGPGQGPVMPEVRWEAPPGCPDEAWVREQIHDLPNTIFYACGPNPLVEFAEDLVVRELGVPKPQMKTEKWG